MKQLLSALLLMLALPAWAGAPIIFSGNDAKTLKSNIDLNGQSKILSGTTNPSSTATSAPIGSIYLNSSTGGVYRKSDAGSSTNWYAFGNTAVVTDPTSYTPTFTGFGTVSTSEFRYWQVGSVVVIQGSFTAGTTTATEARISLPSGMTSSTQTVATQTVGNLEIDANASTYFGSAILIESGVTYMTIGLQQLTTNALTKTNGNSFSTGQKLSLYATVRVSGLTGVVDTSNLAPKTVFIKDVKANQTDGGTFTSGSYQTRVLNTLENPQSVTWASLASNQFTLTAGTYHIHATAPAQAVNRHKAKLRNITDSTDDIIGSTSMNDTTANQIGRSEINGTLILSGTKTFEIQHRCQTTGTTTGYGSASNWAGETEVYTIVEITKL